MDCLDPIISDDLHSVFIHLCVGFSLCLLAFLPFVLLLFFVLFQWAKNVHVNTRLLLSIIPFSILLLLFSRLGRLILIQLLLRHDSLLLLPSNGQSAAATLCISAIQFPPYFGQILRWAVFAPSILSHSLLNSLPLAILLVQLCATIFYKHYEKAQCFLWISIGIMAFQIVSALLFLGHLFHSSSGNAFDCFSSNEFWTFGHFFVLLLTISLYSFNNRLLFLSRHPPPAAVPSDPSSSSSSGHPFSFSSSLFFSKSSTSAVHSISCRYQLRENRRSIRFCAILASCLSILTFLNLLMRIFWPDNTKILENDEVKIFLMDILESRGSGIKQFCQEWMPFLLVIASTLIGHESIRHSLLAKFGSNFPLLFGQFPSAAGRPKQKSIAATAATISSGPNCLAVTNASASSSSSFSSSSSSNGRASRISDAKSLNEMLRNAHFDSLQEYWAKNGPEEKKKANINGKIGKPKNGTGKCGFRSAPCSIVVEMVAD